MKTCIQKRKLLFIGDSITDAFRREDEVNESFQLGNGYVFIIAAYLRYRYPERNFDFVNRGISGQTLEEIAARWQKDVFVHQPDVLTLLAGVNNLIRGQGQSGSYTEPETFEACLNGWMEQTRKKLPKTQIVLFDPFVLDAGMVKEGWRDALKPYQVAVKRQAAAFNAEHIPLQKIFDQACGKAPPEHWSYDGIHPNPGGFMCIARAWLDRMEGDVCA